MDLCTPRSGARAQALAPIGQELALQSESAGTDRVMAEIDSWPAVTPRPPQITRLTPRALWRGCAGSAGHPLLLYYCFRYSRARIIPAVGIIRSVPPVGCAEYSETCSRPAHHGQRRGLARRAAERDSTSRGDTVTTVQSVQYSLSTAVRARTASDGSEWQKCMRELAAGGRKNV